MPASRRTLRAAGLTPAAAAPARLRVGIVGAGRVGAVLGAALAAAGHDVVAAAGLSTASAERAARLLPGVPLLPTDEVVAASDLVVLAVPDDTLPGLVAGLAETGVWRAGQLTFHTSGAHGLAVLAPAERAGVLPLALHPAMTFTGTPEDADRLIGAPFGVTSHPAHRAVAETLVLEMGGEPFFVAEADRRLYHAALVTGANHLVTLVAEAADLLRPPASADPARVLGPLLTAALDNGLRRGDRGLTGPVSRGDVGTVADHLADAQRACPRLGGRLRRHGPADDGARAGQRAAQAARGRPAARPALRRRRHDQLAVTADDLPGRRRARWPTCAGCATDLPGPVALVPTMGALHEGHRAARPRGAGARRERRRLGVRQPHPVRPRRGLRPLPAHLGRRPRRPRRGGRRPGVPPRRSTTSTRPARSASRSTPVRWERARGRGAARATSPAC